MSAYERLDAWIDAHFDEEVKFLQELVRVPTDTPPGNNAPHAERTAQLLQALGFSASKPKARSSSAVRSACGALLPGGVSVGTRTSDCRKRTCSSKWASTQASSRA